MNIKTQLRTKQFRSMTMYALLSELLHDLLCSIPTYYNLSKIDSLSLRLSSIEYSLVMSATTNVFQKKTE